MLIASNRGAGMNIGFPDVCLTPVGPAVVPIPYPNFAFNAMAASFSPRVILTGANALNLGSIIPMTTGDEAGVAHPTIKGMGAYTMGNPVVFVDRLPGICLTCPTTGNNGNNAVGAVLVPSATNVFYTYATPGAEPADLARGTASAGAERAPVEGALGADGIGHLRVHVFSADVPARVFCALREMERAGLRELVIDLRGCPGGELTAATELLSDFLPAGSELLTLVDGDGDETVIRGGRELPYAFPLTLRVDRGTASAAEVFAGALAAHGRAVIEGEATYGKDTVQAVVPLPDGGAAYATVARVRLPGGRAIAGLTPRGEQG